MNQADIASAPQAAIVVKRRYRASVDELWALWTTREGFESWWGPEGFRVEVHEIDARADGKLSYDMIADSPEAIAAMESMGQPLSHGTTGWFAQFDPPRRLVLKHMIDFVPGSAPYESAIDVDFREDGDHTQMIVTLHPHLDPQWTQRSVEGFNSQLTKLDRRYGWTKAQP